MGRSPSRPYATLIVLAAGAVERLAVGEMLVTAAGAHRPVRWVDRRQRDLARHPNPQAVWPVRVTAGAFGDGLPKRDLWMSPGHNVFVGGVLMPVRVLINGVPVTQLPLDRVTYGHVELDSHDVILVEGLPAESYLDTGNRTAFGQGGVSVEAHPDFEPKMGRVLRAAGESRTACASGHGHPAGPRRTDRSCDDHRP